MKEFDVFIKKHITETNLLIYSIPYRDGVSVANRLILETMLDFYTLQKAVAITNKSVLVSEIDKIISHVREMISSSVLIESSVDFCKKNNAALERTAIELNLPAFPMLINSFFRVRDYLGISSSTVDAISKSSLGNRLVNSIEISSEDIATKLQSFSKANGSIQICSDEMDTKKHSFERVVGGIEVSSKPFDVFYCYKTGLDAVMSIACDVLKTEIHFTLGNGYNELAIESSDAKSAAVKHETVLDNIELFCAMTATLFSHISIDNKIQIDSNVSAGLKRKRWVHEVRDMERIKTGEMSLQEFFYVTLV